MLASVCLSKLVALLCYLFKADKVALYCSVTSYVLMFLEGLYLLSYKNKISRVCAAFLIGIAGILIATNILMLYYDAKFGAELILSSVIAGIVGIMMAVSLICHYVYRHDRKIVSKLDGISTTAYLSIKDQVEIFGDIEYVKLGKYDFTVTGNFSMPCYNAYKAGVFGEVFDDLQQEQENTECVATPGVIDGTLLSNAQDAGFSVGTGCHISEVLDSSMSETDVEGVVESASQRTH